MEEDTKTSMQEGLVSLTLGVLGIIFSIVIPLPFVGLVGLILGIIAIIFGSRSWKKKNMFGLVGFILGVAAVLLFVLVAAMAIVLYLTAV